LSTSYGWHHGFLGRNAIAFLSDLRRGHRNHHGDDNIAKYAEYFSTRKEYTDLYRYAYAFHPFHAFSMVSCAHIAEMHSSAIYIVGAVMPGLARGMGMKTRASFEEALDDAKKKYVGDTPNILALPRAFTTAAMHICMKN